MYHIIGHAPASHGPINPYLDLGDAVRLTILDLEDAVRLTMIHPLGIETSSSEA